MKKWEDLSEEQKTKVKALAKSSIKRQILSGMKICTLLLLANAAVIAVDILYVQNPLFPLIGGVMNAIFILPILHKDNKEERDRVNEELKKILAE